MKKLRLKHLLATVLIIFSAQFSQAQKFVIPILPDTQNEISGNPEMFFSQMNWIAAHQKQLNIPFVLHVGDVINWPTPDQYMWKRASDGFKILDSVGIPYAITPGNHDGAAVKVGGSAAPGDVHANVRDTKEFNTFFPTSRFAAQRGRFEAQRSDNAWYTFTAGGLNWLVLSLEFCPRQGPIDWANQVIGQHPDHNVIILTHFFLTPAGQINPNNGGYGDLSPQALFDQLIKVHPNVKLVFSGHVDSSAKREDIGTDGNHIYEMLQDYQNEKSGNGFIRLVEIDPKAGTIAAKMYSPYTNETRNDSSQFTFTHVKFVKKR